MQSIYTDYPNPWQKRLNGRKPVYWGGSERGVQQTQLGLSTEPLHDAPVASLANIYSSLGLLAHCQQQLYHPTKPEQTAQALSEL